MTEINWTALAAPFDESDLEWRAGATNRDKTRALALPYITNRAIMQRLDDVVGPANWKNEFSPGPLGGVLCGLSIRVDGEWVTKYDGADNSDIESVKGGLSDAMKRAGVQWGIGRYLYSLESVWWEYDPERKQLKGTPRLSAGRNPNPAQALRDADLPDLAAANGNGNAKPARPPASGRAIPQSPHASVRDVPPPPFGKPATDLIPAKDTPAPVNGAARPYTADHLYVRLQEIAAAETAPSGLISASQASKLETAMGDFMEQITQAHLIHRAFSIGGPGYLRKLSTRQHNALRKWLGSDPTILEQETRAVAADCKAALMAEPADPDAAFAALGENTE